MPSLSLLLYFGLMVLSFPLCGPKIKAMPGIIPTMPYFDNLLVIYLTDARCWIHHVEKERLCELAE